MLSTWLFGLAILAALGSVFNIFGHYQKRRLVKDKIRKLQPDEQNRGNRLIFKVATWFRATAYGQNMAVKLLRSDMTLDPFNYLLIIIFIALIFFYLLHLILNLGLFIDLGLAVIMVRTGVNKYLHFREQKLVAQVNQQLPEVSRLLSSAIKAGLNIQQGLELVSQEMKDPSGAIFRRLARELQLGTDLEHAVGSMIERVQSQDLSFLGNTLIVQYRAGGSLGRVLAEMAKTLEMRERVNQEIKGSTSESRFIAQILPIMPIMAAVILNLIIPGFLKPLLTLPGLVLTAVFMLITLIGFTMIKKVTQIKV